MCGILFTTSTDTPEFIESFNTLAPRGPDDSNVIFHDTFTMGHTRLAIVRPATNTQPIQYKSWRLIFNGEIYNHGYNHEDAHTILTCLEKYGPLETPKHLDGVFAYVLYNVDTHEYYAARDPIGVIPLYTGFTENDRWFASELKALKFCDKIEIVKPGTVYDSKQNVFHKYTEEYPLPTISSHFSITIKNILTAAVKKRLPDVPWGVFLSGGLDSSIILGILSTIQLPKSYPVIHTFTIGLKDSVDLQMARKQVEFLSNKCKIVHHEYSYTVEEGIKMLEQTIYAIETYDVTTVRASVPQLLLASIMKKHGIKVVLSGEGSDELYAGYLYNKYAPSPTALHEECVRKMDMLHYYDCLRTNKTCASVGVECRVPFLDKAFVHYSMSINPTYKMSKNIVEKHLLREAFKDVLHPDIYNRSKAQFSDSVGFKWIDGLKAHANKQYDTMDHQYIYQTPKTKEALLYRDIFQSYFPNGERTCKYDDNTVACSSAIAHKWGNFQNDPSARSIV